jgi:uncharacterized protein YeaO (DUF488 family)
MIKTKCILEPKNKEDGTRICVMRFVQSHYDYDTWLPILAPSIQLLEDYRRRYITWGEYEKRYLEEMKKKNQQQTIKYLKQRNKVGEIITLLCHENNDKFCHRRLLKKLIENAKI